MRSAPSIFIVGQIPKVGVTILYRMLARNPKTGADLRIIQLETSVWRDQKTVVWFDAAPAVAANWSRWDIGACSPAADKALKAAGITPDIVMCLGDVEESYTWLKSGAWSSARLVVVPRALVEHIGMDEMIKLRMSNILCLDEMNELYPFTGHKWDGSVEDAKALVALALHYGRTFPAEPPAERLAMCGLRGLACSTVMETPRPLWFITQYYVPLKARRAKEIDACLQKNLECPLIDRVVLLNEVASGMKHAKLQEEVVGKRLTYADVIRWVKEKAPENAIIAFANADIFLAGDSWRPLWSADLDTHAKFLALLRWDVEGVGHADIEGAKLFGPRADSQDTWVVSAKAVKAVEWDWAALNFPFGQGGCDNAITIEMFKKRFLIANPALSMRTYHFHTSEVRTYDPRNIVDKPAYLYIHPSGLHDMKPVADIAALAKESKKFEFKPFARPVRGPLSQSQAMTFCTMVARATQGAVELDVDAKNMWAPPPVSLHRLTDVFQTREGLAYTYDSILVGKTKASKAAWGESQLSSMAASISVEDAMIAPLPESVVKNPAKYVLQYLSKVLLLKKLFGSSRGEFWCAKQPGCVQALKAFRWEDREVPVLSLEENLQTWCSNAAVWGYEDTPAELISQEEVGALREALGFGGGWLPAVHEGKPRLVVLVDPMWVTEELAEELEAKLPQLDMKFIWVGRTALEQSLQALRGAWGFLLFSKELAPWSWVLPRGAFVWEIQSEMEPSATLLHVAGAAELEHRLTIVAKGVPNAVEKAAVVAKLVKAMGAELSVVAAAPLPAAKPQLFLPSGHTGFFAHAGDSFREMAGIWSERGYVDCVPSKTNNVWLDDTLLYDRPTLEWLDASADKKWSRGLFGNPAPPAGGVAWSFWPRRPTLVEAAVARGAATRPWESRDKAVVFYGRSENAVQRKRRTAADWAPVCDEFVHVDGVKPYPYSQAEYLEKLAAAKYGLCLAGYGNKCHREIECMAMGCVPVVAPEVDMDNYAEPPQEGLHYFRVREPADVKRILGEVTAERWTVMSAACRDWWARNASADGLWKLTQKLVAA
jgi:hypothetical protein